MELQEFESVRRWLNGLRQSQTGSSSTEKNYLRWFNEFIKWTGKTPDQLIAERKKELKSEDEAVKRRAEERLQQFAKYLETEREPKKLDRSSSSSYQAAVRSFYTYNYLQLKLKTPKVVSKGGVKPHTIEQVQQLLAVANPREKVAVLLCAETGMSREDVANLRYGDVKEEFEAGKKFVHMEVVRTKEQVKHDAFLGPNTVETLRTYLDMRKRVDRETITDKSPLIKSEGSLEPAPLAPEGLSELMYRLGKKAGIPCSPHRFRKLFESNMGITAPSLLVKYWMGHSLGVERSYFIPHVEEQRKVYMASYEKIDVRPKPPTEMSLKEQKKRAIEILIAAGIDYKSLLRSRKVKTPEEEVKVLHEKIGELLRREPQTATNGGCQNGDCQNGDCQRIVSEQELPNLLAQGWRVAAVLPSGKIVVDK